MKLTIELDYTEYNLVDEALRRAGGNVIPNDFQRLELQKLRDKLTDASNSDLDNYPVPLPKLIL